MSKHTHRAPEPFEVWMAILPNSKHAMLQGGCCPVVVISKEGYDQQPYVSVVPLTKNLTGRQLPTHVLLCSCFWEHPRRALCEQVMPLEKKRLIRRIGCVEDAFERFALRRALAYHLNLYGVPGFGVVEEETYDSMNVG